MSQNQGNRKRRGRGRGPRGDRAADHQAQVSPDGIEDQATFWARSDARLGIDPATNVSRRSRAPAAFACAMCGEMCALERWPKRRHDVICDTCKDTSRVFLGDAEERKVAEEYRRTQKDTTSGRYRGLPQLSDEDKEAITESRSRAAAMGNGKVGNRRRGGGGGGGGGDGSRRKRGRRRNNSGNEHQQQQQQQHRNRDGGGGGGGGGGEGGEGGGRKRRRRRRGRRRGGGDTGNAAADGGGNSGGGNSGGGSSGGGNSDGGDRPAPAPAEA